MIDSINTTDQLFEQNSEESTLFTSLRAQEWQAFHGQDNIKKALQVAIKAANDRQEAVDHILLYGPPGLGKTTLSHLIAKELEASIVLTSGTALAKTGDLAAILTNLGPRDVLFIDEIHRLPTAVEEMLYSAMEDYALDIVIGKGPSARTVRLELQPFTLVGATTKFGMLSGPFRDRFGLIHRLYHYSPDQLENIILQASNQLKIKINQSNANRIAVRSRGTPRIALKIIKRVRDMAQVNNETEVSNQTIKQAFSLLSIDEHGLTEQDRRLLLHIVEHHKGGPVGLSTLAAALHEDPLTIEEVVEPFLLEQGFIAKTPKGRIVSDKTYLHLNYQKPG